MRLTKKEYEREVERILRLIRAVGVFDDTSEGAKRERRERGRKDKLWFFKTYFPHYFKLPFANFHREIVEIMDIRGEDAPATIAIQAPRGHGKSTIVSFANIIHEIVYKKRRFIVLVSATEDMAIRFVMRIRLEFENNPRLLSDFGDMKGKPWSDEELVANGVTLWARGTGQALRGAVSGADRPDLVIMDDIETDELVRNPRRIEKLRKWVLETVYPAMDLQGTLYMIGTKLARNSVLAQFLKDETWIRREYVAIMDGKPLWPNKFSLKTLEAIKRKIGSVAFNKEYMGNPKDEEGLFREEWIRYYEEVDTRRLRVYMALDPSVGSGESNDYKAIVIIGVDSDGIIYVLDAWIRKASIEEMIRKLYMKWEEYHALVIGIETNVFQKVLLTLLDREARERGLYLPIRGIEQRVAKEARIARLSPLVERGIIRFRKGQGDQDLLIEQLLYFPNSSVNDDGPDALEMAVSILDMYSGRFEGRRYKSEVARSAYGY